jgi:hypothetical protein
MHLSYWMGVGWFTLSFSLRAATYSVIPGSPQANDDGPGTVEHPWKTLTKAAATAVAGDRVLVSDGVYRERVVATTSGTVAAPICFEAAPGAHVVVTGADQITGWRRIEGGRPIYRVAWPHRFVTWNAHMTHPDDEYHRLIGRCEQVAVDGYLLRQVLEAGQLAPGTFFADVTNQALLVWDYANRDLNKELVEACVRQEIFRVEGDHVQLRGLRFRFAANMAQHGAVVLAGRQDTLEDCTIEAMNSTGATFAGEGATVRRCVFRDNGQLGFGASHAHDLLFTECLVENNNTKGFNRDWEAGGTKLVLSRHAVLERSRFVRNRGPGIWFDIGNEDCTVRQCLIADNEDCGIFYEISFGLLAHDNVIVGNGFAQTAGAWGAQAGIALSSSPGCLVERNLILGNREGFNFREQSRTTRTIKERKEQPVWNHDEIIRRNILVLNRDAQVWGWFDMKDNRHWPAKPTGGASKASASASAGSATEPSPAKGPAGQTQGLTLEQLRLQFIENIYFAAPGQGWFNWGVSWGRHKRYPTLAEFQAELGIDSAGAVLDPGFADIAAGDYRLRTDMMARLKEQYPQGPVPGVTLGVRP